jgi:hypothetical protein
VDVQNGAPWLTECCATAAAQFVLPSARQAGWNWRAENDYSAHGNSESFEQGGYAFDEALESRVEEMRDDHEAGMDPDY